MNVIVKNIEVGDETHACYCTGQCKLLKYCPNQRAKEEELALAQSEYESEKEDTEEVA